MRSLEEGLRKLGEQARRDLPASLLPRGHDLQRIRRGRALRATALALGTGVSIALIALTVLPSEGTGTKGDGGLPPAAPATRERDSSVGTFESTVEHVGRVVFEVDSGRGSVCYRARISEGVRRLGIYLDGNLPEGEVIFELRNERERPAGRDPSGCVEIPRQGASAILSEPGRFSSRIEAGADTYRSPLAPVE